MPMHDINCTHPKPHFSRMHYQLIADALLLKHLPEEGEFTAGYYQARAQLADMLQADNHLFDRQRFYAATNGVRKGYR